MPKKYFHPDTDWFAKRKLPIPTAFSHGIEDTLEHPLSEQMPKNTVTSWKLEGNKLIAQTEHGEVAQYIPTDYILTGVDNNNLPILTRVSG